MKYAVLGAGAVGSGLAGSLYMANQDVILIDPKPDHIQAIIDNGLRLNFTNSPGGKEFKILKIKAAPDAKNCEKVDMIFVCTKGVHTRAAMENAKLLAHDETVVVTYQNGWGNADILEEYFPGRVGYACVYAGGSVPAPGVINCGILPGSLHMPITSRHEAVVPFLKEFESVLEPVDFNAKYMPVPEQGVWHWSKLIYNCVVNATCALANCPMDGLWSTEAGIELGDKIVEECLEVAHGLGFAITKDHIYGAYPAHVQVKPMEKIKDGYRHYPSLVQDVVNKRQTETYFLNGAMTREGKKLGIATPYNDCVDLLTRVYQATYDDNFPLA